MKSFTTGIFLITLFSLSTMHAQSQPTLRNYEKEWKKAEDFVKKELPQSALAEVKKIYQLAKNEKQEAQVIKALVYMIGLQQQTREDNAAASIQEIEKEISSSNNPAVNAILNSLLAELYWAYYQDNRWKFYNRTQTTVFEKEDIATWGAEDFHEKVGELYLQSIKEEKLLQQTRLEPFDAIIIKGNMRHLRPTLYDLLARRALSYFENDERDITKPAYAFQVDQAAAFDPAADFANHTFSSQDSGSLAYKALLIYQQLIRFHLADAKPDALIDADLQRIAFVKEKSVHPDKDLLYYQSINHIARQYENTPAAAQAWYLLALYHADKADSYKPYEDTTHRYARIKAREIAQQILLQKDSSEGKVNAYNLLHTLNQQELEFNVEKINLPNQPFRVLVKYRNFSTLYLRIIKADAQLKKQLENGDEEKYWPAIIAARPLTSWEQTLPATNDLQTHLAEIKAGALAAGEYFLLAGTDKDFANSKTLLGARLFYVSSISFVNNQEDFFVLHRDNGQPLAGAAIQEWSNKYDYKQSKYIKEKGKLYQADANGFFRRDKQTNDDNNYRNTSYLLDIAYQGEHLFMDELANDYYYRDYYTNENQLIPSLFFFTDRSLYRPGQTLFFKGIVLSRNNNNAKTDILPGRETTVYLRDANYEDIDSITLRTNEFGSFSGKFQLPASGLNGYFSLYTKNEDGQTGFRVEEYKRPKFYVDYQPLKGTYQVNDTITITGMAKAYAGNMVDGARVSYRVVRVPRFIYPWLARKWWMPPAEPVEIINGETTTGKDGTYQISFAAIPDLSIDKKMEPVFDYTVYADVTDINGETRSGEQNVSVSYKALLLKTDIPATIPVDSLQRFSIRTENMNGEYEPALVQVTMIKLKEEKRLIRERFWDRPDQFVMTKSQYLDQFPYDEYDNEADYTTWEKGEKLFEKTDSVKATGSWELGNTKLQPGYYQVEILTKDKNGAEVKDIRYTELYDPQSRQLDHSQYFWTRGADPVEPGEKTTVQLGSSADNLFLVQAQDKQNGPVPGKYNTYSYAKLNKEKKTFEFAVTEADRGGYGVSWAFVKHNRFYQYNETIQVPWTNKELTIEYATYRDKTLPGSEEKWKLKISGYKNEKVAAELLGSMYDASLDQFYPHNWYKPFIWSSYSNINTWTGTQNFEKVDASVRNLVETEMQYLLKEYDHLFQNDNYNGYYTFAAQPRLMRLSKAAPVMEALGNTNIAFADGSVDTYKFSTTAQSAEMFVHGEAVEKENEQAPEVQVRKNFNETAFFFPDLITDSTGAIEFSFTLPEALTRWKFQALAHTKALELGYSSKEIVTQKQLMVQPNPPRFLREGDKMEFSAKIVNLTEKELTGLAELALFDAATNQPLDSRFRVIVPSQYFTVAAGQSEAVKFAMEVPFQFNKAVSWRIIAKADAFSDGEEAALPVLTNRMLVTETLPLSMKGNGSKDFTFPKLLNAGSSETLENYALTIEYTSNPVWYAVQALPYLMEYPYECAEQTWNRYYANALATLIANSAPRIRQVFEQWKTTDTAALLSNLQKNPELKALLLEETPWVLQAKSETEQKRNIALLFDMVRMSQQLSSAYEKLKQMQSPNGGFVWFSGGPDDRYITQYIVSGIGHLKKLKAITPDQESKLTAILELAIPYLDRKIKEEYDNLVKSKTDLTKYTPAYTAIQYLYLRSFFPEYKIATASQKAVNYFKGRLPLTWTRQNKYMQGMIALSLYRSGDTKTPAAITRSLKETSIYNEELGRYWKDASRSWWWYEAPLERQALLVEVFQEIGKDTRTADELRTWLLKNKETNRWETTKATAEACYALLLQGTSWLGNEPVVTLQLGNTTVSSADNKQEAGTGYFKTTIDGEKINPEMGNISVTVSQAGTVTSSTWGGVYWQYFEDLDKITTAATPLQLVKKLFVEKNSDRGPVLTPVNDGDMLQVGDKVKVRIELRTDRDMEYVHMKDMRAASLEPVNVLSGYKWQGGLGYYETTKDASTNFFFSSLPKGTYVFEYSLFVTHTGNFSNGITSIQCMYAPAFASHSEGIRINVE